MVTQHTRLVPVASANTKNNCTVASEEIRATSKIRLKKAKGVRLQQKRLQQGRRIFRIALPWTIVIGLATLGLGARLPVTQQTPQKFCGTILTEAMDRLCVNGFNGRLSSLIAATRKRDANNLNDFQESLTAYEVEPSLGYLASNGGSPYMAKIFANTMVKTRRRRDGGVYEECCRKTCSHNELSAYCRSSIINDSLMRDWR